MLYTLQVKETNNILYIRPKQNKIYFKPFVLTFQKQNDAHLVSSKISGKKSDIVIKQNQIILKPTDKENPNLIFEDDELKFKLKDLINTSNLIGNDLFIIETIILDKEISLNGYMYEINQSS